MHQSIVTQQSDSVHGVAHAVDKIMLHRDPQTDDWVFDLTPGIDLLEVVRVLGVVQQHALSLLEKQLAAPPAVPANPPLGIAADPATANAFAQL